MTATGLRRRLVDELARHHRTLRAERARTLCACGDWYEDINEHLADELIPVLAEIRTRALNDGADAILGLTGANQDVLAGFCAAAEHLRSMTHTWPPAAA